MKNYSFIFLFMMITNGFCQSPNNGLTINIQEIKEAKLYKIDRDSKDECYDEKNGQVMEKSTINPCFNFIRNLKSSDINKMCNLLNSSTSFVKERYDPFTSDFGLIFYDKQNKIITAITFSYVCNRYYSIYRLASTKNLGNNPGYIGFSKNARRTLQSIFKN